MTLNWHGDELLRLIREGTPDALFEVGEAFIEQAAGLAPKRSGTLARSGYVKNAKKSTYRKAKRHRREKKLPDEESVIAAFAAFYAGFVEHGTKKQAARPFIRPTLDSFKGATQSILTKHFRVILK